MKKQNFTYWEPIDKLSSSMLDLANFNLNITVEKIVEIIKSIDFSRLEFKASDANDEDSIYKDTLKKLKELLPIHQIYVLDGNETKHFIKFLDGNYVKKITKLDTRYFKNGFVFLHTTGKDDIIRWFYLNQPNKAMYLLSELSKP